MRSLVHNENLLRPLKAAGRTQRVFRYCRVSTRDQSENNLSLPLQAEVTEDYIDQHDCEMSRHRGNTNVPGLWYDPGVSAWKTPLFERPGFRQMWNKMRAGDAIVMLSLDRGWRSVQDFLMCYKEFLKYGIQVMFARGSIGFGGEFDSPMTRFILTGEANIAELKSELVSERVREGWVTRKRNGLTAGSVVDCEAASETGYVGGKVVKPVRYRATGGNDWGAAYRELKSQRKDVAASTGRVFGYVRVSTADQSPVSQKKIVDEAICKFCSETGWASQITFVDHGVSAFNVKWHLRPEGKKLWEQYQKGDHVFILCADRAFRSISDMADSMQDLEDRGVILHFIRDGIRTDQGSGMRLLQSLSLAAQWEWEDQSSRIRLSLESNREKFGIWPGASFPRWMCRLKETAPGGIQLIPDHDEIDRMIQIHAMVRGRGKTTWTKLTAEVEAAMAERDGRRPVYIYGCSLHTHRLRSTPEQNRALNAMIHRKTHTFDKINLKKGWKRTNEIHPEIARSSLVKWEKKTWKRLMEYVSVKPEIFGDARERVLEVA